MDVLLFPCEGTQYKGMGRGLWSVYPQAADAASHILGYSLPELCLRDPHRRLRLTQYAQPALYVVQILHYYRWQEGKHKPTAVAGHGVGEYAALFVAGCFDFETGLRLIQKRAQLMAEITGGAMLAVHGITASDLQQFMHEYGLGGIDLVYFNAPTQLVIAGDIASINIAKIQLSKRNIRYVPLNINAPFHSRYMEHVQKIFEVFLHNFHFNDPQLPVIANATASPYRSGQVANLLAKQITSPVLWVNSMRYLMKLGDISFLEMGADPKRVRGTTLGKFLEEIWRADISQIESSTFIPSSYAQSGERFATVSARGG